MTANCLVHCLCSWLKAIRYLATLLQLHSDDFSCILNSMYHGYKILTIKLFHSYSTTKLDEYLETKRNDAFYLLNFTCT